MLPKPLEPEALDPPERLDRCRSESRFDLPEPASRSRPLLAARGVRAPDRTGTDSEPVSWRDAAVDGGEVPVPVLSGFPGLSLAEDGPREVVVLSPDVDLPGSELASVLRQQLHQSTHEVMLLRAKLGESEKLTALYREKNEKQSDLYRDTVRDFRLKIENLVNCRGFRLLRAFYGVRLFCVPRASRREQWIASTAGAVLSAGRRIKAGLIRFRSHGMAGAAPPAAGTVEARLPASVVETAALEPATDANEAVLAGPIAARSTQESPFADRSSALEGLCNPLSWQVGPAADCRPGLVNLILLSAVHRSGSTLLQRLCNARSQTLIWGEHGGILRHFVEVHRSGGHFCLSGDTQRERYFRRGEDPNVWIADMCPGMEHLEQGIVDGARSLLNGFYRQYADTHDLIGFKEVQYGRAEAELLRQCFPQAEMLLLVRNPFKTWNSTPRHWYPSLEQWMRTWSQHVHDFIDLARNDTRCHLIRYEDLLTREPRTIQILCEVARLTREQIENVMAHKIGSIHAGISGDERRLIAEKCREPMGWLGYA